MKKHPRSEYLEELESELSADSEATYPIGREMKDRSVLVRILIRCRWKEAAIYDVLEAIDYDSLETFGDIGLWEFDLHPESDDEELDTWAIVESFIIECHDSLVPQQYLVAIELVDGSERLAWARHRFQFPDVLQKISAFNEDI